MNDKLKAFLDWIEERENYALEECAKDMSDVNNAIYCEVSIINSAAKSMFKRKTPIDFIMNIKNEHWGEKEYKHFKNKKPDQTGTMLDIYVDITKNNKQ